MSLHFNLNQFTNLFTGSKTDSKTQDVTYTISDSEYHVKAPAWLADGITLTVLIEHHRDMASDDHATLSVTFGPDARICAIECIWQAGNDGYKVPQNLLDDFDKATKLIIEGGEVAVAVLLVAGAAAAPETEGLSLLVTGEVAADIEAIIPYVEEVKEVVDTVCNVYNGLVSAIIKHSDNGGRLYSAAVIAHVLDRLANCVSVA